MASTFSLAIEALVQAERRAFLTKISVDYKINLDELLTKYSDMVSAAPAAKVPRKYTKKDPKSVEVDGKKTAKDVKKCEGITSKNVPCKFSALKGGCLCKRHQRKVDEGEQPKTKEPKPAKPVKVPKADQPMHTHPLDSQDPDCELCNSHGNPLVSESQEFEEVVVKPAVKVPVNVKMASATGPIKVSSVLEKLKELMEDIKDDEEMMEDDEEEIEDEEAEPEPTDTQLLSDYEDEDFAKDF